MEDKIKKIELSIESLNDKKQRIYFFVQDTKGNAKASIRYTYQMAMALLKNGYNPRILHEKSDYFGVQSWLGEEYMSIPHSSVEGQNLEISPEDIIIVPEIFGYILPQINNLPCGVIKFMAVPVDYEHTNHIMEPDNVTKSMFNLYSNLYEQYPKSLYEFMRRKWPGTIKYTDSDMSIDYHPTPVDYKNYLIDCGVPITQEAINYAHESLDKLLTPNISRLDAINMFPECGDRIDKSFLQAW